MSFKRFFLTLLGADVSYLLIYLVTGFLVNGFVANTHCNQTIAGNIITNLILQLIIFSVISIFSIFLVWLAFKLFNKNFLSNYLATIFLTTLLGLLPIISLILIFGFERVSPILFPNISCY